MKKRNVYIGELESQITFAQKAYQNFVTAYNENKIPETFMNIHHFLIHISNIDIILDVRNNAFRKSILGDSISYVDLKPFRRIRNHLEHLDDRLDQWIKDYDGYPFFDMNFITGATGFPKRAFLRALDCMIFKFHGEDYDLEELWKSTYNLEIDINKLSKSE